MSGASLVAQWLRICLPMQGTGVRSLVREDPTCRRTTKPVATTTEACVPRARALQQEKPLQWEAHAPQWRVAPARHSRRKACAQQRRPNADKNKIIKKKKECPISENGTTPSHTFNISGAHQPNAMNTPPTPTSESKKILKTSSFHLRTKFQDNPLGWHCPSWES